MQPSADADRFQYPGSELDLFADAVHWKAYWSSQVRPYVRGRVLEVGAGVGATGSLFAESPVESWTAVEPDGALVARIRERATAGPMPAGYRLLEGSIAAVPAAERFDLVLYIDVLEHIEDDAAELRRAGDRLVSGGHVVVLAPAHPFLYSPFDRAIGHYRRYNRRMLRALDTPPLPLVASRYLDSAGLLASAGNRLVLRASMPTRAQVQLWDRRLVPVSRWLDRLTLHRLGKSVLGVFRKR
jgi:SAM-dependent methyltransferase